MNVKSLATEMDGMVSNGKILDAVKQFFAENATTSDYGALKTVSNAQMVDKMEGFLSAIENVNGITHHHTIAEGDLSSSEFTFDFDMKDGSKILWHEIIRRVWKDGKVINEQYFDAK